MKSNIYSIRDRIAGVHYDIFLSQNDDLAIRTFNYYVANRRPLGSDPSDLELYKHGFFDDESGVIGDSACLFVRKGASE